MHVDHVTAERLYPAAVTPGIPQLGKVKREASGTFECPTCGGMCDTHTGKASEPDYNEFTGETVFRWIDVQCQGECGAFYTCEIAFSAD